MLFAFRRGHLVRSVLGGGNISDVICHCLASGSACGSPAATGILLESKGFLAAFAMLIEGRILNNMVVFHKCVDFPVLAGTTEVDLIETIAGRGRVRLLAPVTRSVTSDEGHERSGVWRGMALGEPARRRLSGRVFPYEQLRYASVRRVVDTLLVHSRKSVGCRLALA
jgi:hypothetical protein